MRGGQRDGRGMLARGGHLSLGWGARRMFSTIDRIRLSGRPMVSRKQTLPIGWMLVRCPGRRPRLLTPQEVLSCPAAPMSARSRAIACKSAATRCQRARQPTSREPRVLPGRCWRRHGGHNMRTSASPRAIATRAALTPSGGHCWRPSLTLPSPDLNL